MSLPLLTHNLTQNGKQAGGGNGAERTKAHLYPGRKVPETV